MDIDIDFELRPFLIKGATEQMQKSITRYKPALGPRGG
jgi:hypothetical protein